MAIPRTSPRIIRLAALTFVATAVIAGPPGVHVSGSFHGSSGGYHTGGWVGGARSGGYAWGARVGYLPRGYATYRYGGNPYFFSGGYWYRPWGGVYLGCYPPVGICLPLLPIGYSSFYYNDVHYYSYEDVYYTDAPLGDGYVVATPPPNRPLPTQQPAQPIPGSPDAVAMDALIIMPKEGQSKDRMKADRADAQRYAVQKSGYDPAYSDPNDPGTARARRTYLKAMRNYLEEHGYSVE